MGNCVPFIAEHLGLGTRSNTEGDTTPLERRSRSTSAASDINETGTGREGRQSRSNSGGGRGHRTQFQRQPSNSELSNANRNSGTVSTASTSTNASQPSPTLHRNQLQTQPPPISTKQKYSPEQEAQLQRRKNLLKELSADKYSVSNDGQTIECPICMIDFEQDEDVRYLPCRHCFHTSCIDDWLLRNFSCPSCMLPVDSGLLSSFPTSDYESVLKRLTSSPAQAGPLVPRLSADRKDSGSTPGPEGL